MYVQNKTTENGHTVISIKSQRIQPISVLVEIVQNLCEGRRLVKTAEDTV